MSLCELAGSAHKMDDEIGKKENTYTLGGVFTFDAAMMLLQAINKATFCLHFGVFIEFLLYVYMNQDVEV